MNQPSGIAGCYEVQDEALSGEGRGRDYLAGLAMGGAWTGSGPKEGSGGASGMRAQASSRAAGSGWKAGRVAIEKAARVLG